MNNEPSEQNAFRIDFHHHIVPNFYRDALSGAGVADIGRVPFPDWSEDQMLKQMVRLSVHKAILSLSAPGVDVGNAEKTGALAAKSNDFMFDLKRKYSPRIDYFATLPLPDVDRSMQELERIAPQKPAGVILLTNYDGNYLGTAKFSPLLEELNRRRTLVFIHPTLPTYIASLNLDLPPPILEFVFDTTRMLGDMIFNGTFDRYPNIRWIVAHLGGALPFLAWRLSLIEYSSRGAYAAFRERGRSVLDYLRGLYYDTAVSAGPASIAALLELVGPSRIVYGSDVPFAPLPFVERTTQALTAYHQLDAAAQETIAHGNGEKLLSGA
ncbi:MAG: amidohydrolase family protein [Rhizomicrobium sp.]